MKNSYKYIVRATNRFKKAAKRMAKRGKDSQKLKDVVEKLAFLSHNPNALHLACGAVPQEIDSRGFRGTDGLELGCGFAKTVCREFAQAYALHVKHVVILERVLL
jgi:hypothetical protein